MPVNREPEMGNGRVTTFILVGLMALTMEVVVECSQMTRDDGQMLAQADITSCSLDTPACSGSAHSTHDGDGDVKSSNCTVNECACSPHKICVRKCCPLHQVLVYGKAENESSRCVPEASSAGGNEGMLASSHFWHYIAYGKFKAWSNLSRIENVHVVHGRAACTKFYHLNPDESEEDVYQLAENGSLIFENVSESRYCVEYVQNERLVLPLLCLDDSASNDAQVEAPQKLKHYLMFTGLLCSIVFLLLTFSVYALVPPLQNLQGKNLLCYVSSLIVANSGLLAVSGILKLSDCLCVVSALVIQFAFLASFFWLNIMCFDLWCTFSGRHRSYNGSSKESDLKKFIAYCLYAWGCPALIVAVTIFLEFYPSLPQGFIRPQFGTKTCFFETKGAIFIYFYSFLSVIVLTNLCMFIHTAFVLKRHKKQTRVLKRSGSRRHLDHDKQRFNLYLKLFIVMGVNWILEVMSFYVPQLEALWLITDIGNTLQGVLIFLIFVCKRRTLVLLNKRLLPNHPFVNKPKKNSSTATSVISLASVRSGTVSLKPPVVLSADKLDEAC